MLAYNRAIMMLRGKSHGYWAERFAERVMLLIPCDTALPRVTALSAMLLSMRS
jgi:hypothetical protein